MCPHHAETAAAGKAGGARFCSLITWRLCCLWCLHNAGKCVMFFVFLWNLLQSSAMRNAASHLWSIYWRRESETRTALLLALTCFSLLKKVSVKQPAMREMPASYPRQITGCSQMCCLSISCFLLHLSGSYLLSATSRWDEYDAGFEEGTYLSNSCCVDRPGSLWWSIWPIGEGSWLGSTHD
jgi:hypothetical protein